MSYMSTTPYYSSMGKYNELLEIVRNKVKYNFRDILKQLEFDEWCSLIFLILDKVTLINKGYIYCENVLRGHTDQLVDYVQKLLLESSAGADVLTETLFAIQRYDLLEDFLGLCLEHNLHMVCLNLKSLYVERKALHTVFVSITEAQKYSLLKNCKLLQFSDDKVLKCPMEILFLKRVNTINYRDIVLDLYHSLRLIGCDAHADSFKEFAVITDPTRQMDELSLNESFSYPMPQMMPHGLCVIVNVKRFLPSRDVKEDFPLPERHGSDIDSVRLEGTFRLFGFQVHHLDDPDTDEFQSFFLGLRCTQLASVACLVVCIMTHGDDNDEIYLYDRKSIATRHLRRLCYNPDLIGIPKLIFVQACRGDTHLTGSDIKSDCIENSFTNSSVVSKDSECDCLIATATIKGHSAFRSESAGSWFISDLCTSLQEFGHKAPIHRVLNRTRELLIKRKNPLPKNAEVATQLSEDQVTLTKDVYLKRAEGEPFYEGLNLLLGIELTEVLKGQLKEALKTMQPLHILYEKFSRAVL